MNISQYEIEIFWLLLVWFIAINGAVWTLVRLLFAPEAEKRRGGAERTRGTVKPRRHENRPRPSFVQERRFALMLIKARVWGHNPVIIRNHLTELFHKHSLPQERQWMSLRESLRKREITECLGKQRGWHSFCVKFSEKLVNRIFFVPLIQTVKHTESPSLIHVISYHRTGWCSIMMHALLHSDSKLQCVCAL